MTKYVECSGIWGSEEAYKEFVKNMNILRLEYVPNANNASLENIFDTDITKVYDDCIVHGSNSLFKFTINIEYGTENGIILAKTMQEAADKLRKYLLARYEEYERTKFADATVEIIRDLDFEDDIHVIGDYLE